MAHHSKLVLRSAQDDGGRDTAAAAVADGVPYEVEDAGLYLNHGILVGELLGLDGGALTAAIDEVDQGPEGLPRMFISDDTPIVCSFLDAVVARLGEAVDDEGRPRSGELADALAASPLIATDDAGRLMTVSRRVRLDELRERLRAIVELFRIAGERGWYVEKR